MVADVLSQLSHIETPLRPVPVGRSTCMLTVCENNAIQNKITSVFANFVQNKEEIYPVTVRCKIIAVFQTN